MDWKPRHFITGWPCVDFANTVVYRGEPGRRIDRLQEAADIEGWRCAALAGTHAVEAVDTPTLLRIREAIDGYFRAVATGGDTVSAWQALAGLYGAHAEELGGLGPEAAQATHPSLAAALLHSAMALAFSPERARLGECGGCGWLFVDRTRNRSKRWCTSALCGNRAKARRHYARSKAHRSAAASK